MNKDLLRKMKNYFWTGIASLFPILITGYVIYLMFSIVEKFIGKPINHFFVDQFGYYLPGIGFVVSLFLIVGVGFISSLYVGRWFQSLLESILRRIPVIGNIYPSAKKVSEFLFSSEQKKQFKKVVLVEYPGKGNWSIGFITNEKISEEIMKAQKDEVCVFIPLAPAPFSGFIVIVTRDRVKEIDLSIEEAIKFVFSAGVVTS